MFESNIWILFNNNYFLSGIFLVFLIKYILVFGEGYYENGKFLSKKFFMELTIGLSIISLFALSISGDFKKWGFENPYYLAFIFNFIIVVFFAKIVNNKYKTYGVKIFENISILNLYLPIFILVWAIKGSFIHYLIALIFLISLTYFFRIDRGWVENIFYIIFVGVFLFGTVTLNNILFDSIYANSNYFFQMSLGIFLLGCVFGYLYFVSGFYLVFLFTYLPGKREHGYLNRMKIRTQFVTEIFYNDYSLKWSYLYLCVLFIFFTLNSVYNFVGFFFILNLFFLTNIFISYIRSFNLKKDFKIE